MSNITINMNYWKKLTILLIFLLILPSIVLGKVEIEKEPLTDTVIPSINKPAEFKLTIKNLDESDTFRVYDLAGYGVTSNGNFSINSGQTKTINIEVWPEQAVLEEPGTHRFVYKIKGKKTGLTEDLLTLKILPLNQALEINSYNINFEANETTVYVKNLAGLKFDNIKARFYSSFFDFNEEFSLNKYEKKEFVVNLDRSKIRKLSTGTYTLTSNIETFNTEGTITNSFKFAEKADVSTSEKKEGIIISKHFVEKENQGNLPIVVQTKINKNVISRLFTTFNNNPSIVKRQGLSIIYTFQQEIQPSETFKVEATTNWLWPIILLLAIGAIVYLSRIYILKNVNIKKKATYVKTKGGEFALKISILVKARKYVENLKIEDKIPSIVKVHKRFGAVEPDKIDEKNRRLEWNIENLQKEEERIFSYVIYSKISPVGRFELPKATAIYEKDGNIKEEESNKVYFLTERKKKAKK